MKAKILRMETNVISIEETVEYILDNVGLGGGYICVSNVHMCMEVFDSVNFARIVNESNIVVPDGRPIFWAQRLLGCKNAEQVRGQDLMNSICAVSGSRKLKIGLYGGSSQAVLNRVKEALINIYPDVELSYLFSPPFRPLTAQEDEDVCESINELGVDVLFVGIGCPKQEIWMHNHVHKINCTMLGVGAAFDFVAGEKKRAPCWMQVLGMEWLYRLSDEPRRLCLRYFKNNPRFLWFFLLQLFGREY